MKSIIKASTLLVLIVLVGSVCMVNAFANSYGSHPVAGHDVKWQWSNFFSTQGNTLNFFVTSSCVKQSNIGVYIPTDYIYASIVVYNDMKQNPPLFNQYSEARQASFVMTPQFNADPSKYQIGSTFIVQNFNHFQGYGDDWWDCSSQYYRVTSYTHIQPL